MTARRYQPRNPFQAIDPKAFFWLFNADEPPENEQRDDVTIVTIRGPLTQHSSWWEDSYEAIRGRVEEACQQAAPVVVLRIDSPGGDVAGCFDTARAIRAACDRAGKRLLAHTEGQCTSAAYALATAAERIFASRTAQVGSIGIIAARLDETRALENMGYKVTLISSGARKADGFPVQPMGRDELESFQADIDSLAAEFFDLVSIRRGVDTQTIAAYEAASFRGDAAMKAGLVDELGSFDHMLASIGAGAVTEGKMEDKEQEARDALRSIAEDEECSDEERERARRALAALDGDDDDDGDDGDEEDEPSDDDEPDEDEPSDDDEPDEGAEDEEDDDEARAAAAPATVSASTAGAIAAHGADVERRLAKLERREAAAERKRLIAAHGGVPKGMAKLLATKPLSEVKALLAELPKPKRPKLGDHAATTTVPATRGAGQDKAAQLPPKEARSMREAMGMDQKKFGVVERGNVLMLGAPESEGGE